MGVDITFFAEQRTANGEWVIAGDLVANPAYFPEDPVFANEPKLIPPTLGIPRCSALFAILANVNNTRTPEPYETIVQPRGLPDDATSESKIWFNTRVGAFAASWLTLDEIDDFNWDRITQHYGNVDAQVAHLFDDNPLGFPFEQWPADLTVSYTRETADTGNARWRATYAESAGFKCFREMLIPFEKLEMVRFIFWFNH